MIATKPIPARAIDGIERDIARELRRHHCGPLSRSPWTARVSTKDFDKTGQGFSTWTCDKCVRTVVDIITGYTGAATVILKGDRLELQR